MYAVGFLLMNALSGVRAGTGPAPTTSGCHGNGPYTGSPALEQPIHWLRPHVVGNASERCVMSTAATLGSVAHCSWRDAVDMDFVEWLTRVIILHAPTEHCHRRGSLLDWHGLAHDKSLFHSLPGCGLPIGNLTSRLFSNVYLNEPDQYVKRQARRIGTQASRLRQSAGETPAYQCGSRASSNDSASLRSKKVLPKVE